MSLAETLIGHMIDPNNKLVTQMMDQQASASRQAQREWYSNLPIEQKAMWKINNTTGEAHLREPDDARATLKMLVENARYAKTVDQPQQVEDSGITNEDLARTLIAIVEHLKKLGL